MVRRSIEKIENVQTKEFFAAREAALVELASQSGVKNLRSLSWALFNAVRFVELLLSDADIPSAHVERTMKVVAATTLWYRNESIDDQVLGAIPRLRFRLAARTVSGNEAEPLEPKEEAAKRFMDTFPDLNLGAPPVGYEFIASFERSGVIDSDAVLAWVTEQFGYGENHKEPAWRQLWHAYDRPRENTATAFKLLAADLEERKYTKRGEILHAAGLAVKYAALGTTLLTNGRDVVEYFQSYIDDVFSAGTLEGVDLDASLFARFEAFGSLGFASEDTQAFGEIRAYLNGKQQLRAGVANRAEAEQIIQEAEAGDLEGLYRLVRQDNLNLAAKPVLAGFDIERLVELFSRDMPELDAGARLLAYRYGSAHYPSSELAEELPWARHLYTALMVAVETWNEPHRSVGVQHLSGLVRHYDSERPAEFRIAADLPISTKTD